MSELLVPSFSRKLSWAQRHIERLELPINEFRDRHPYRTRKVVQGQRRGKWIVEFTEKADPDWSLMVGDILYNLRATLDHLACALNPSSQRSHVMFPIVRERIWEIPYVEGERRELTDARQKWDSSTRRMDPRAVTVIKRLQPTSDDHEPFFHMLDLLNRLSNKDRHRRLHVHTSGLTNPRTTFVMRDLTTYSTDSAIPTPEGAPGVAALQDKAVITPPPELDFDAIVDVQISATATQAIEGGDRGRQVVIPDTLWQMVGWIREQAITPLSPLLHGLRQ